jgi:hypothetical protein
MNVLEREVEDLLWYGLTKYDDDISKKGINFYNPGMDYFRQPVLGSYGKADIIGINYSPKRAGERWLNIQVIEIKKDEVNIETLTQACRYVSALKLGLAQFNGIQILDAEIILIGRSIDLKSDFCYCLNDLTNLKCYTYDIDFHQGVFFKEQSGFHLRNGNPPNMDFFLSHHKNMMKQIRMKSITTTEDLPF